MEKEQKKKLYKLGLPIIMGTILLLGVSYAWLTLTLNGTKTNVLKAGTLSLTLTDTATNGINMQDQVPMLDEVGVTTSPYTFTLKNNGTVESEYTIYLDDVALDSGETKLPDNVIKYNLVKDGTSQATALLSTIGSNPNRVLDSGVIKPNETYNYDLRLWLDQDATIAISGQVFKGKIRVEASQIKEQASTPEQCFEFDESTGTITKFICASMMWDEENYTTVENTNSIKDITDIIIPKKINGIAVKKIGDEAFMYNIDFGMSITSVMIPDGVEEIGNYAFKYSDLKVLALPDSIIKIGSYAFEENYNLGSLTLSSQVQTIGAGAFHGTNLGHITIPSSVKVIEVLSFAEAGLKTVELPNSITTIEEHAFRENQLTSITIPSSVTSIGYAAFASNRFTTVIIKGKSSTADFSIYDTTENGPFGWASGYSDANITWQP